MNDRRRGHERSLESIVPYRGVRIHDRPGDGNGRPWACGGSEKAGTEEGTGQGSAQAAADADPRMAALVVGLATSNSFILPTHQVNAFYMGPGGYRSVDFVKAGTVISIVFLIAMISAIYLVYGV